MSDFRMESIAGIAKRLTLEVGGNGAAIMLEDLNPKEVWRKIYAGAMFIAGPAWPREAQSGNGPNWYGPPPVSRSTTRRCGSNGTRCVL